MSDIYAHKIKFNIQRNVSEFYPIIIETNKDVFPLIKSNKTENIIFLPPSENEIILPGKITEYRFYQGDSNLGNEIQVDYEVTSQLSYESTYLFLTRWVFYKCKRIDIDGDLFRLRERNDSRINNLVENLTIVYLNHLLKPYAKYIRKNSNRFLIKSNINDLFKAIINLGNICLRHKILKNEKGKNVDIIIPSFGKFEMTLNCLLSIYRDLLINRDFFKDKYSIKIIVAEDQSQDNKGIEEMRKLSNLDFFYFLENEYNLGFLENCNNAVKFSRDNSFLVFLNNDIEVLPGWLLSLLETYNLEENIGLVGSKLIYPDNKLQEAGGIIWQKGNGWNFGRMSDPDLPDFLFSRNVDYISGASIMIQKELFLKLKLFDNLYKPAYYEDTDLAMKVRENNLKVVFQPQSQVIHLEGQSCGTDLKEGIKSYQVKNKEKFYQKWSNSLQNHYPDASSQNLWNAINRNPKGSILIIEDLLLDPDGDAGSLYMMNICLAFRSLGYSISYIPTDNYYFMTDKSCNMGARGIEVISYPRIKSINDLKDFKGNVPLIYERNFDLAIVARPSNLGAIDKLKSLYPNIKIIYYTHDLHYMRLKRTSINEPDEFKKNNLLNQSNEYELKEKEIFKKSDLVLHVSEEEEATAQLLTKHKSLVLPPVGQQIITTNEQYLNRFQLLFLGNFNHTPNIDGIIWFVDKILPIILKKNKNIYLNIAGGNCDKIKKLIDFSNQNINLIGYVDDLSDLYNKVGIGIAPLKEGAGVKGKVLSYLSAGLPVVATYFGGQGITNEERKCDSLIIRNKEEEIANEIINLTKLEKKVFEDLSFKAKLFESNYFGPKITISRLKSLLHKYNLDYNKYISTFKRYQKIGSDIRFNQENSFTVYSNQFARQ